MLTLKTRDYGTVEYEESDVLSFPDGLFGFTECKHFIPLCLEEGEDNSILLLQSIEMPEIAFVVINPFVLEPDYAPVLRHEELNYLQVSSENELSFYVICVLHEDYLDNTVNLKCPIILNPTTRTGMQVILSDSPYEFRHRVGDFSALLENK
ncbi:flagellar assembly protein FliW [[Clostridium] aminophilum]|jgi:flagellar assembly factor FliW|uniref:flagellar assembly protein FliW n=1 Tax=[Clostridium] aminophilum TaxID=1526 RepID=UPI0033178F37